MKNEKFLEAMGNINDDLVLSAMEEPAAQKTKPFRKIKWTVLAACIILALAIPTVAYIKGYTTIYDEENNSFSGELNYKLKSSDFNQELLDYPGGDYPMKSINLAEKFLGTPLPNNIVLDCATKQDIWYSSLEEGGEERRSHCWVNVGILEDTRQIIGANVCALFVDERNERNVSIMVHYSALTENSAAEGPRFGINHNEFRDIQEHETYVNAAGREFEIVTFDDSTGGKAMAAVTDIDGYLVYVDVSGAGGNYEDIRATLLEVLEAYN